MFQYFLLAISFFLSIFYMTMRDMTRIYETFKSFSSSSRSIFNMIMRGMTRINEIFKCFSSLSRKKERKHIPVEIIEQILLRLPAKSVIRFRLVCKLWCNISSDPSFAQKHLNFANKNPGLYLVRFREDLFYDRNGWFKCNIWSLIGFRQVCNLCRSISSDTSLIQTLLNFVDHENPFLYLIGFYSPKSKISIFYEKGLFKCDLWTPIPVKYPKNDLVGSCNGLVCMHENEKIVVFNPLTRESIVLPNCSIVESYMCPLRLAKWSFGYNPNSNEYMVIHFYEKWNQGHIENEVQVCTLGKDISSWRQIEVGAHVVLLSRAINIGATMYWKVRDHHDASSVSILFFDLSEEKFGRIECPQEEYCNAQIMDLNGRLCWVSVNSCNQYWMIKLWALDEYEKFDSNWTLLRSIQLFLY